MDATIRVGRLLVATPALLDPNFRRTVALIVEHESAQGTLGVVLNRPSEVPVDRVLAPWSDLTCGPAVVFRGGPVAVDSALALAAVRPGGEPLAWRALDGIPSMARVGLVDLDVEPETVAGNLDRLRVFAGYAGWGPGQLDEEVDEGAWYVLPGEVSDAFANRPDRLWADVLRRAGGRLALAATCPDDPAMN